MTVMLFASGPAITGRLNAADVVAQSQRRLAPVIR
jgi:hypothetical protein